VAEPKKLVVMISRGLDEERLLVAFSITNGGITSDLEVRTCLTSNGVDWVRQGAAAGAHPNP
jgi:hypothetical protein